MTDHRITCDRVDRDDLDTGYLAGKLDETVAEAFEEHFFSCDRCWALVHRGAEVRSARPGAGAKRSPGGATRWRRLVWAAPLAPAAALALWIGTRAPEEPAGGPDATVRSATESLTLTTAAAGGVLRALWVTTPGAASYRVRLFSADGSVLWERRVTDTTLSIVRDSIPGAPTGALFWQVQALDLVGSPLARSPLVSVPPDSIQ